jgi:hypothetical protein
MSEALAKQACRNVNDCHREGWAMAAFTRREVLKAAAAVGIGFPLKNIMADHGPLPTYEWIRSNRTLIAEAYNPPFYPSLDYAPAKAVEIAVALNCDSMRYPAASFFAYFPTKSGYPVHPELTGDPMRTTLELLRKANLRSVAYVPLNHPFMLATSSDPRYHDWSKKFADGTPMITDLLGFDKHYEGCLNSLPLRSVIQTLMLEVLTEYPFDVMYFDGPYQGLDHSADYCHCHYCEAAYQKRFGRKVPNQATMSLDEAIQYTNWMRDEVAMTFLSNIRTMIRQTRDVPVLFNNTSLLSKTNPWRGRSAPVVDGFMFEAAETPEEKLFNLQLGKSTGKVIWTYLGSHTEYNSEHLKDKHMRGWYSFPFEGEELLLDGAIATAAGTGCVYWGMQRFFYQPEKPLTYEEGRAIKKVFDFQEKYRDLLRTLKSEPQVGILVSDQTINWYAGEHFVPRAYGNYYHGAFHLLKTLSFEGEPFLDWSMTPERLRRYQMVWAPSAVCLSDAQCEMLRRYVQDGGVLIATHLTSVADEYGRIRRDFGLADVFGASFVDPEPIEYPDLYLQPKDGAVIPQDLQIMRIRVNGGEVLADTLDRGNRRSLGPAVVRNNIGKGQVIYIGSGLEAIFEEARIEQISSYLGSLISPSLMKTQSYRMDYVSGVTPHYMASSSTIVLHLLADIGDKNKQYRTRERFVPVTDLRVRLRLPGPMRSVSLMCSGDTPAVVEDGTWAEIKIPRVFIHEAIKVDLA